MPQGAQTPHSGDNLNKLADLIPDSGPRARVEAPPLSSRDKRDEESQDRVPGEGTIQHLEGNSNKPFFFFFWPKKFKKKKRDGGR